MLAPLPGASVLLALGVGVLPDPVEPAAVEDAVLLEKVPLLAGTVALAGADSTGTTKVVGATTTTEETGARLMLGCISPRQLSEFEHTLSH